mmetsp:Transcript_120677/g.341229  ORF Transcript_120677/g.341229 Transcript_120677/m.341229 type:complete len:216 (+) Transcript_120677:261-908(+)
MRRAMTTGSGTEVPLRNPCATHMARTNGCATPAMANKHPCGKRSAAANGHATTTPASGVQLEHGKRPTLSAAMGTTQAKGTLWNQHEHYFGLIAHGNLQSRVANSESTLRSTSGPCYGPCSSPSPRGRRRGAASTTLTSKAATAAASDVACLQPQPGVRAPTRPRRVPRGSTWNTLAFHLGSRKRTIGRHHIRPCDMDWPDRTVKATARHQGDYR